MQLNIDPDDAVREIGIIVSLAMQADGLEPVAARCLHADIASRLARSRRRCWHLRDSCGSKATATAMCPLRSMRSNGPGRRYSGCRTG